MKAHLKTSLVRERYIVEEGTGEVKEETVKKHTYLAATKEQFFLGYVSMLSLFYGELSGPEIKVYAYLLDHYNFGTTIGIIKSIKTEMSAKIGIKIGTIDNALGALVKKKLLYSTEKAAYKLNPRYAFKGSTADRNKLLKVVLEMECPDC